MNKSSLFVILTILMETLFIAVFNQKLLISNDLQSLKSYLPFANVVAVVLARHIQTLQAMLYLGEIEKATEYIEGISESYWHEVDIVQVGHPAVTALLNSKKQVAQSRGVEFDFSVKCNLAGMRISAWDFCSILGNLVDNALEAVITEPDSKVVTVEIKAEEEFFAIYVYNTGPRITRLQQNNLFKPGYTTKKSDGRGYGLYVVKKLVDSYGGTIEVISDRRTTFIIYLPKSGGMKIDKKSVPACS